MRADLLLCVRCEHFRLYHRQGACATRGLDGSPIYLCEKRCKRFVAPEVVRWWRVCEGTKWRRRDKGDPRCRALADRTREAFRANPVAFLLGGLFLVVAEAQKASKDAEAEGASGGRGAQAGAGPLNARIKSILWPQGFELSCNPLDQKESIVSERKSWLGRKDSNLDNQSQSLMSCR